MTWTALLLGLLVAAHAEAQVPVCDRFDDAAIAAVAGEPIKEKVTQLGPDACVWSGQRSVTVARIAAQKPEAIDGMLAVVKRRHGDRVTVTEESGLGDRALLEVSTRGRDLDLWVASGATVWRFTVNQVGAGTNIESLVPALKALAKAALRSTANCQLPTPNSQLPTANSQLPTANSQLPNLS